MAPRGYVLLGIFFFACTLYHFINFVNDMKGYRAQAGNPAHAIVVLTGGTGRVEAGLDLLRKRLGGVLILSGVNREADLDSIFMGRLGERERLRVVLEKKSRSTYENAVEIKKFMTERNLNSLILVTSIYHMKRASYIFKRIMPTDVLMETYPVFDPDFDENWWRGGGGYSVLFEFTKYYWYYLKFNLEVIMA
ncbi:MAG: YdcF family protein [Thermodesulfobacteriota bacterium]